MKTITDKLSIIIATLFGIGFVPFIPGTFGSIAGAGLYYFLRQGGVIFYAVLLLLAMLGFWASSKAESALAKKDPKPIIIDEAVGMMISFISVPFSFLNMAIIFVLFRIFDVVKPYPIRRLEHVPGGAGIMLDDIVAGLYANIIFQIIFRFALCRAL